MPNFEKIKLRIYFALSIIFFVGCANVQPPSGGPPDTIPPRIVESYPNDKTLNFNSNTISILFSEWVDRNGVLQNISISPSIEYSLHWSGKRLNIRFNEPLKSNTTYSFLLGTEYADLKSNKPDSAFGITFSTGNIIDSGIISGKIIGKNIVGTYVYGYKIDALNSDTLNPEITKADYSTQVGNNGQFSLRALKDGRYRLFAVKTNFRDNLFHPQQDFFGTTNTDVEVQNGRSFPQIIKINKYPNLLRADISRIIHLDSNLLNIEFTKKIPLALYQPSQFQIIDTITNNIIPISAVWLDSTISSKISILTQNPLQFNYPYKFKVLDSTVFDSFGVSLAGIDKDFYSSKPPFNFSPKLMSMPFRDSSRNIGLETKFQFIFNYPIVIDTNKNAIELYQFPDSVKVKIATEQISPNILQVNLKNQISADTWYRFFLHLKQFSTIGNRNLQDTILKLSFKTYDWRPNPSISGHITGGVKCPNIYIILKNSKEEEVKIVKSDTLGNWQIDYVVPDTYTLEVFCDDNANGQYDYGRSFPYQHSELFEIYEQKIEIKPRWNIEKINLTFPTRFIFTQ